MQTILISVISSLVASLIYGILIVVISSTFKKHLVIGINRLLDTGITCIYKNQNDAVDDIKNCFSKSKTIKVLTLRGNSFLSNMGPLSFIVNDMEEWQNLTFLISNPYLENFDENKPCYAKLRADELKKIDRQKQKDFLGEIEIDIKKLKSQAEDANIEGFLHNSPAVFRLLIFDNDLFLLFYASSNRAINNRVYRCPSSSELYTSFNRYFKMIKDVSDKIT